MARSNTSRRWLLAAVIAALLLAAGSLWVLGRDRLLSYWVGRHTSAEVTSASARAGPFGLAMGMTLKDLQASSELKEVQPYEFSTFSVPDGHPDFKHYTLIVTPSHGLCAVMASTPLIKTTIHGEELRAEFNRYRGALSKKYGIGRLRDSLQAGSLWGKQEHWMMGLRTKERSLLVDWPNSAGDLLPNSIRGIFLEATADALDEGRIVVSYGFNNSDVCLEWIAAKKDSKL